MGFYCIYNIWPDFAEYWGIEPVTIAATEQSFNYSSYTVQLNPFPLVLHATASGDANPRD